MRPSLCWILWLCRGGLVVQSLSGVAVLDRRSFGLDVASRVLLTTTTTATTTTAAAPQPPSPPSSAADSFGPKNAATSAKATLGSLNELQSRMEETMLEKLPLVASNMASSGVDNLRYPPYMEGTWNVTQKLTGVQAPLGARFLNPDPIAAERSLAEARSKLGQPVRLQLRYVPTKWGTAEDRAFNSASRLNAFAGKRVVASVEYADVRSSNRDAVLRQGGTWTDPLSTVLVRYKGPAAQKVFVTSHASLSCDGDDKEKAEGGGEAMSSCGCWVASESQRSIFALTNENTAPPIVTDSEVLYEFHPSPESCPSSSSSSSSDSPPNVVTVTGRLRIASYLNPMDKLYFDARNRAVSLQDYTLEMRKVAHTSS